MTFRYQVSNDNIRKVQINWLAEWRNAFENRILTWFVEFEGHGRPPIPGSIIYLKMSNTLAVCCKVCKTKMYHIFPLLIINILGSEHLLHTTELNLDLIKVQFVNTNHNMNETQCDMNVVFCLFNLKRFLLHICSRMAGWDSRLLCWRNGCQQQTSTMATCTTV